MHQGMVSIENIRQTALVMGIGAFLVSLVTGTVLTYIMTRLSNRWDIMDRPDGFLKHHLQATATLGGIPLLLAIISGVAILAIAGKTAGFASLFPNLSGLYGSNNLTNATNINTSANINEYAWFRYFALFVAGIIIIALGIHDDIRQVKPRTKLLFQTIAATILVASGLLIRQIGFVQWHPVSLGILAVPFSIFWLVGSCNAFNFIDGIDGLACGIGILASLTLAGIGFVEGSYTPAIIALAVAGGLLAVLIFNFHPAMIFLGDSGSQLVGFILGILSIQIASNSGVFNLPVAGIILTVPIIDTFLAILRRYSLHRSPAQGDQQHIHHCLQRYGFKVANVSLMLWSVMIANCVMAFIVRLFPSGISLAGATLLIVSQLYLGIKAGCLDLRTLFARLTNIRHKEETKSNPVLPQMQENELKILWERMKPLFRQMRLDRAILTLQLPADNGHGRYKTYRWVRSKGTLKLNPASRWTKRFALQGDEQQIAILKLESEAKHQSDEERIEWLLQQINKNMQQMFILRQKDNAKKNRYTLSTEPSLSIKSEHKSQSESQPKQELEQRPEQEQKSLEMQNELVNQS